MHYSLVRYTPIDTLLPSKLHHSTVRHTPSLLHAPFPTLDTHLLGTLFHSLILQVSEVVCLWWQIRPGPNSAHNEFVREFWEETFNCYLEDKDSATRRERWALHALIVISWSMHQEILIILGLLKKQWYWALTLMVSDQRARGEREWWRGCEPSPPLLWRRRCFQCGDAVPGLHSFTHILQRVCGGLRYCPCPAGDSDVQTREGSFRQQLLRRHTEGGGLAGAAIL